MIVGLAVHYAFYAADRAGVEHAPRHVRGERGPRRRRRRPSPQGRPPPSSFAPAAATSSFGAIIAGVMYGAGMAGHQLFLGADTRGAGGSPASISSSATPPTTACSTSASRSSSSPPSEEARASGAASSCAPCAITTAPSAPGSGGSLLYAVAHASTLSLLAHPVAGWNPLLVAAAFGGGLVWGHLYNRTGRLAPGMFAHALFSWAIVDFPLWRP
ncbi:MAG: CPBP family intramembrane glutamic endopeptidase [Polyangiaceae bacterium]